MTRETRLNLIFLGVILAIMLPGAVMLFRKKMDPTSPPMFMPDYVRRRLPYMAPQEAPTGVVRVIPDATGAWVERVNRERGGGGPVLLEDRRPVVSDDHTVQVTGLKNTGSGTTLDLIVWTPATRISVTCGDQNAKIVKVENVPMPSEVKKELMNWGVVRPPHTVVWVEAQFAKKQTSPGEREIRVSYLKDADGAVCQTRVAVGQE
jgi:hypothetical protein